MKVKVNININTFIFNTLCDIYVILFLGAILVFMPGWEDISKVNRLLTEEKSNYYLMKNAKVYPLHSLMPTINQREIFQR